MDINSISDNAVYGKAIADMDGKLFYVNKFFAEIHGYTPDELIGKHLSVFHTPEQLEEVEKTNASLLRNGHFETKETWHDHRNGTTFPMLMSGVVIKDEQNNPEYIAVSAVDITESKRAALKLQQSENRYRTIFNSTGTVTLSGKK
ncbi:MAG: PAS domain S-box protein [Bacteroidota bacterium]|nr:PAS domain S-box protein [Bacteroidota bacterium]